MTPATAYNTAYDEKVRLFAIIVFWLCLFGFATAWDVCRAADAPQITAQSAFMIDGGTGTVLFEKNADALSTPASTTKIMTAELVFSALKEGKISLDTTYHVSEHAWRTGGALARGSAMFAALNSDIRVEDLLRGLLVDSGNDAAIVLAEGLAGSQEAFVALMNEKAGALGLSHLTFANPWGEDDPKQRVSARDMVMLARHVISSYPDYYKYFGEKEFTWNKIRQLNRNPLVGAETGVDGLKTGYIDAASGYSVVASSYLDNRRIILALYGSKSVKDRMDDARKLFAFGFHAFDLKTYFKAGEPVGAVSVIGGSMARIKVCAQAPVAVLVPRSLDDKITARLVYQGPLQAPVEPGLDVGSLIISRNGLEIFRIPVFTAEHVGKGPMWQQALDIVTTTIGSVVRRTIAEKLTFGTKIKSAHGDAASPYANAALAGQTRDAAP